MNLDEFRQEFTSSRRTLHDEAIALKDSQQALSGLFALYQMFSSAERAMANQVLTEWVLSTDENLRFDALALIDEFEVTFAAPALKELGVRLRSSIKPGAPYELKKAERILQKLTTKGDGRLNV